MQLRPYQEQLVASVLAARGRGLRRVMAASPTGTGKTISFVALHNQWPGGGRTLVLAHREELLTQAAGSFLRANPGCWVDVEQANRKASRQAQIIMASVQTVGRPNSTRLDWFRPNLVICDECHHSMATTYRAAFERFGCFADGGPFLLGVTATPKRLDRLNLRSVYQEQVFDYSIRDACRDGWLCDIRGYRVKTKTDLNKVKSAAGDFSARDLELTVDNAERTAAAVRHWQEVAAGRPTIAFCAGVAHSKHTTEAFREQGVVAEHVDGGMSGDERRGVLQRFKSGRTQVLTNVDIATEGFDYPALSCVLMLRPTQSWALYVQAVGRGTRICSGKDDLIVIDVVDNCDKHSLATVPAILDLPVGLDLQGKSLAAAADKLDELGAKASAIDPEKVQTFLDLETMLEQVDLLAGVEPPQECRQANCRLGWLRFSDGSYYVSCGNQREALLKQDLLGRWTLTLRQGPQVVAQGPAPFGADAPIASVLFLSDKAVRKRWPDSERMASTDARWKTDPPTDRQLVALQRHGIRAEVITTLTRGQASALISQQMARKRSAA